MSAPEATVWREGDRIRATDGMGFADSVPDANLRKYAANPESTDFDRRFAAAVLAIREFERCDPFTGKATP
jgi:hypothetical protein